MSRQKDNKPVYRKVARQIAELIKSGELKPGDKLPAERNLAEKLNVSRSSVREAIKTLAQGNLVESRRGDGTYIKDPEGGDFTEAFARIFAAREKRISDIFQFRRVIEPEMAALAAVSMDDETLDRMKVIVCNQQIQAQAGKNAGVLDSDFHLEIARATGNSIFPEMMVALDRIIKESRSECLQTAERQEISISMHFKLLEAFENRDPETARMVMKQHIAEIKAAAVSAESDT
ncbi:FadR/GntR family transcriptional regulator [Maridesulfovibrio sp.]|uniref:FadR/GntR family transcriptional regulator n=1 Tax=Maridesulfovibrio sp. TaxID=2795000 RepID=UPI002A18DE16|nr:FadR/GntR family transcriptional regulator [Maridesulfovibrio sp.]